MRCFRFIVIFFVVLNVLAMLFPCSSPCQSDAQVKAIMVKINELKKQGNFQEAIPLTETLLKIVERRVGPEHDFYAITLNNLASLYVKTGRYTEAEHTYKRAIGLFERKYGMDHQHVATCVSNLAEVYYTVERYDEAEKLLKRSLAIRERAFGPGHPDVGQSLYNLAMLYWLTGRYVESEELHRRALSIRESALGPDHISLSANLNGFAVLCQATGRYGEAEELFKRALAIREKALDPDHPDVAQSVNNLAVLYWKTERHQEAVPLFKRALGITERTLGPDHPDVASGLNNLAHVYRAGGHYKEAAQLYERSLAISEKALGKDHNQVATTLNNLAVVYNYTGRVAEAGQLLARSLAIREKAFGPDHPDVAQSLFNLACVQWVAGRSNDAHGLFVRASLVNDKVRDGVFLILQEKQKLAFVRQNTNLIDEFLFHTVSCMAADPSAVEDTFNAWIRWKGSVLEAQGRYIDALTASNDPVVMDKFRKLTEMKRQIARLQLSGPGKIPVGDYMEKIAGLQKDAEALEAELMTLSRDFSREKKTSKADMMVLSSFMPKNSAYLDYARIRHWDFAKSSWSKPRYLLFVLTTGEKPWVKLVDVGDAENIDAHAGSFLKELNRAKTEGALPDERKLRKEASVLYDLLIKPVEPLLKGRRHLLISPDGDLNLIPFEAMTIPAGSYLIEKYLVSYVGAGRDMVKFAPYSLKGGTSLVMADPDYDLGQKGLEQAREAMGVRTARERGTVSRDMQGMHFDRLPDTKEEANAIEKILKGRMGQEVANYQNTRALEDVLFNARSPRIIHLATHGYFLKSEEIRSNKVGPVVEDIRELTGISIENPMLRSGIVLAGANTSIKEGTDEGMVTAEKILGLNFKGTDLVVLSACETGVGDVKGGEGVFGLKRAFTLSGAKTLVMSLWSVPSKETVDLMTSFYKLLSEGRTGSEAMRQAKLALMKKKRNPFFWGAFTVTGTP